MKHAEKIIREQIDVIKHEIENDQLAVVYAEGRLQIHRRELEELEEALKKLTSK